RIIIAGTTSGVGKTSITLGILYILKNLGFKIQSFKIGPDFIDPSYHHFVTNSPSYNLDSWLMGKKGLINTFEKYTIGKDIAVIEGVMGLFDGAGGKNNFASTAQIAKILNSPIILVIDASKAARSIAAIAYGFMKFEKGLKIKGIILNKISSNRHFHFIKDAFENKIKIPIVGVIYRNQELIFSERHLGLIPREELDDKRRKVILNSAKILSESLDAEKIVSLIRPLQNEKVRKKKIDTGKEQNMQSIKIAVALDESFNFYYQENLDTLQEKGAQLIFFSPLNDLRLPEEVDGIIIGGGFPEILAKNLSRNQSMMRAIKKIAESQIPIYAECGGLMYLSKSIKEGTSSYKNDKIPESKVNFNKTYRMIGLIDAITKMTDQLTLNYTQGKVINESLFGNINRVRGHEFHFSVMENISNDSKFSYYLNKGKGITNQKDGIIVYNTLASFTHLHFSNTKLPERFILNCKKISRK
ncbi:MAG: hydrogenobyrinic acid a,c-diamide synthase (glutamine-hydrolyzing), partial [Nitrososphaeraceae archaeon]|nr:hydrogenobyrinic acid a,c-diamide synthase (glutamine-hydrolyzing) [Nitrososphaeraceae archaeon]